jgi:hypothetical protein
MYSGEPAEAQSIRSILHIARLLALIFGILLLIGGVIYAASIAYLSYYCTTFDPYCGGAVVGAIAGAIWLVISGIFLFFVYTQMKSIEAKVDARQYEAAKSQTLIWMILGFIFGIILGIILLIAYVKFDPLINASRQQGQMGGGSGYPPQGYPPQGGPPMAYPPQPGAPTPGYYPPQQGAPAYAPPMATPPPVQAPPPAAAAPATPPPFCSKCGSPTTYIAQYGRYYCYNDRIYV